MLSPLTAGKRTIRSVQVALSASSLNDGDVFLLDAGLTIYQWNGSSASRQEKFKALELATKIKDAERGGKAKLVFLESGQNGADAAPFWSLLQGSQSDVKSAEDGGSDDSVKAEAASLWRISDASGSLQITEVARGKLTKDMLDDQDVFLLDGGGEVFVWSATSGTVAARCGCSGPTRQRLDGHRHSLVSLSFFLACFPFVALCLCQDRQGSHQGCE